MLLCVESEVEVSVWRLCMVAYRASPLLSSPLRLSSLPSHLISFPLSSSRRENGVILSFPVAVPGPRVTAWAPAGDVESSRLGPRAQLS